MYALKYEGRSGLAEFMGGIMAGLDVPSSPRKGDPVVIPVPTTTRRRQARGYDQAELLARAFASARDLRVCDVLLRTGDRPSQTSLAPGERRLNVEGTFGLRPTLAAAPRDSPAILIDDVLTTGATACEAAGVLARAGIGPVTVVTFARALPTLEAVGSAA